jgi:hypothetical protein
LASASFKNVIEPGTLRFYGAWSLLRALFLSRGDGCAAACFRPAMLIVLPGLIALSGVFV